MSLEFDEESILGAFSDECQILLQRLPTMEAIAVCNHLLQRFFKLTLTMDPEDRQSIIEEICSSLNQDI